VNQPARVLNNLRQVYRVAEIGGVLRVRLADEVPLHPGTLFADSVALDPVARLWGDLYFMIGETPSIARPAV
jgi:hypothetical protein